MKSGTIAIYIHLC